MPNDLDARLLAAHDVDDRRALVELYTQAADQAGTVDAMCFYLTHAYIFALEVGHATRGALHKRLVAQGREE